MGLWLCFSGRIAAQQEGVPTMRLVEAVKISGATEDVSSNLPKITVGGGGRMSFYDDGRAQFVFFDSTGKRLGAFGRAGQGPGEFAGGPIAFFYTGFIGDTLWVYESRSRRFTLISPDFKLVRATALPAFDAKTVGSFTPLALLPAGRLLGEVMIGKPVEYQTSTGETRVWHDPSDSAIVVATWEGKIERRVAELPGNTSRAVMRDGRGGYSSFTVPFATGPLRDVSQAGDRVVYVTHTVTTPTGGTYTVTALRSNGDTVFSRSYGFSGERITKRMADSAMERVMTSRPGLGGRGTAPQPSEAQAKFMRENIPAVYAPFSAVVLGIDGTIWLRQRGTAREPSQYLVLDDRGNAIANVTMPRTGLNVHEVSRNAVWATDRDADGFSNLYRFRLELAQ